MLGPGVQRGHTVAAVPATDEAAAQQGRLRVAVVARRSLSIEPQAFRTISNVSCCELGIFNRKFGGHRYSEQTL